MSNAIHFFAINVTSSNYDQIETSVMDNQIRTTFILFNTYPSSNTRESRLHRVGPRTVC